MSKLNALLSEYGESHQNHTNKLIHWFCVPLIFLSIVGMLYAIPSEQYFTPTDDSFFGSFKRINPASIGLIIALLYYTSLSRTMAFFFGLWMLICLGIVHWMYLTVGSNMNLLYLNLAIFVVAWIFQFVGHNIEGKKPSFLKDIQFLLIGPAWLMHFILKRLNIDF